MTNQYLKEVCKIGQLEKTCKYIALGSKGFICGKTDSVLSVAIRRMKDMVAQGDNCAGDPDVLDPILNEEILYETDNN